MLTRRDVLRRSARTGAVLAVGPGLLGAATRARAADAPPAEVHLQFGADPAREMTVSFTLPPGARNPRVRVGPATGDLGELQAAELVAVVDRDTRLAAIPQATSLVAHARLSKLTPDRDVVYELVADGMSVQRGTFRTAPAGRATFRFTAFGDQGTGSVIDTISAQQGSWIVDAVEARAPLVHLHLGDLAYANLNAPGQRGAGWERFMANNARSASRRPWMPILGNHEVEQGMGDLGYDAYLGRFRLPDNGSAGYASHWHAWTVGSVRFVCVDAEDWALQKGGDLYNAGYSKGAQLAWLDRELARARTLPSVDWVVLAIHHPLVTSANQNGSDLGVRQAVLPLLAEHDVDLVLSGHDHDYERSFLLGPPEPGSPTLRPSVVSRELERIDATRGYVHLVLGGGGTKLPVTSHDADSDKPGPQAPVYEEPGSATASGREDVTWVARRDDEHPYGFAEIEVLPGTAPGGPTQLRVTYAHLGDGAGAPITPVDVFTLERPRGDAPPARRSIATHHNGPPGKRRKRKRRHRHPRAR